MLKCNKLASPFGVNRLTYLPLHEIGMRDRPDAHENFDTHSHHSS